MKTLITRKIEPNIDKYFKYLFFLTPIFLFNFSIILNILQFILVIAIIGMALYEIKIYSDNSEFINFIKIDKHLFLYDINLKYFKIFLFVSLFTMISSYMKNLILYTSFTTVFLLFSLLFVLMLAINEREILKTNLTSIVIKYLILIIVMIICNIVTNIYAPIIFTQVLYIFIIANHNVVCKKKINIRSLINISMLVLIELSLIVYSNNMLYVFFQEVETQSIVVYNTLDIPNLIILLFSNILFIFSVITILIIRRLLLAHFKEDSKLKDNLKIFIFTFTFFIAVDLFCNMFVFMRSFNDLVVIFGIVFIYSIVNLSLIAVDRFILKRISNKQIIKRINDKYDSWV